MHRGTTISRDWWWQTRGLWLELVVCKSAVSYGLEYQDSR